MRRLLSQLIIIAVAYVGLFQTDWTTIGIPALPDWISIFTPGPPAPITEAGFRAVIFEETADRASLKPDQLEAITSNAPGSVREYCLAHAAKVNNVPEFRVLDKDDDLSLDTPAIQIAGKIPRTSVPWLVVSNGKGGFSGPLPDTKAEQLAILTKYGGK